MTDNQPRSQDWLSLKTSFVEDWFKGDAPSARSLRPAHPGNCSPLCYRPRPGRLITAQVIVRRDRVISNKGDRMPAVSILLNILWIVFGGLWMAVGWVIAAVIMAITIIGLPWARAAFNIAAYTLLPFGQKAVRRDSLTGQPDLGTGLLGLIGNLIWLVLAGWWLALGHLITAVGLAVTIVGIPFAWAHLKLAGIALWPIGKVIVPA
jgi:uncharacterized membrane protein YccF (DUF307 family)